MRVWSAGVLLAVAVVVAGPAPPARACTCLSPSVSMVRGADAAFVGRLVSSEFLAPAPTGDVAVLAGRPMRHQFAVERVIHGPLADTVFVEASSDGASCGLGEAPGAGQPVGLALDRRDDGAWTAGLCSRFEPELVAAVPAPTSESGADLGPAVALSLLAIAVAALGNRRAAARG